MTSHSREICVDTLVGPTYHFGGLSPGNVASQTHAKIPSHPRKAALEGLEKMWQLVELGVPQLVLPPQERPLLKAIYRFGFQGNTASVLRQCRDEAPHLLSSCSSSSSMWTANSATVTPSIDAQDRRVHITPANLLSTLHRRLEVEETRNYLKALFPSPAFIHHPPLLVPNEGAANHLRFCLEYNTAGIHLFVANERYGDYFPRESPDAGPMMARCHHIPFSQTVLAIQNPEAVRAGVFHNDLIAMGNKNVAILHEKAFIDQGCVLQQLEERTKQLDITPFFLFLIREEEMPLTDLIASYFCNGQLISTSKECMVLLLPDACRTTPSVSTWIEVHLKNSPIQEIIYLPLDESVKNGGGPACLRLPLVLTAEEERAVNRHAWLTQELYDVLAEAIESRYRKTLEWEELADPELCRESAEIVSFFRTLLFHGRPS